jgi:hypothetical protein
VILEADQLTELGRFNNNIANEALVAGLAPNVQRSDAWQIVAAVRAVVMPKQLVASAHCQEWHSCLDVGPQCDALRAQQVGGYANLLAILPTAPKQHVEATGAIRITNTDRDNLGLDPAPAGTLR